MSVFGQNVCVRDCVHGQGVCMCALTKCACVCVRGQGAPLSVCVGKLCVCVHWHSVSVCAWG